MQKSRNTSKSSPTINNTSHVDYSASERTTRSRKQRNHGDEFIVELNINNESKDGDLNKNDDVKASSKIRRLASFNKTNKSFITSTPLSKSKRRKTDTVTNDYDDASPSVSSKDDFMKLEIGKANESIDTNLLNDQQDSFENSFDNVSTINAYLQKRGSQKKTYITSKDPSARFKRESNPEGHSKKKQKLDSSSTLLHSESECERNNSLKKNSVSILLENGDFKNDIQDKVEELDHKKKLFNSNLSSCELNSTSIKQAANSGGKRKQGKSTRSRQSKASNKSVVIKKANDSVETTQQSSCDFNSTLKKPADDSGGKCKQGKSTRSLQSKASNKSIVVDKANDSVETPKKINTSTQERHKRSRRMKLNAKDPTKDLSNDLNEKMDADDVTNQEDDSIQERLVQVKDNNDTIEMCNDSNQSFEQTSLSIIKKGRSSRSRAKNQTPTRTSDSIEKAEENNLSTKKNPPTATRSIIKEVKSKVGRPPKSCKLKLKKQEKSDDKDDVKSDSSITCLQCNKEMKCLAILKRHMMTDHSLVWHPAQPMGVDLPNEIIKRLGHISCQKCAAQRQKDMEGPKQFKFQQYYKHHLIWCGREDETSVCDICKKNIKSMWFDQHLGDHRRKEKQKEELKRKEEEEVSKKKEGKEEVMGDGDVQIKSKRKAAKSAVKLISGLCSNDQNGDSASQSETDFNQSDGDSDESDEDDDGVEDDGPSQREDKERFCKYKYRDHRTISSIEKAWCTILLPAVRMSHERRLTALHEFYQSTELKGDLFPELLPHEKNWVPLNDCESLQYTPQQIHSEKFVTTNSGGTPNENVLDWGQSKVMDGKAYCYAGGPIWSLEWCPYPESAWGSTQTLALSADLSHTVYPDIKTLHTGPGLVQIWSFGKLNNQDCISEAVLKYCLAHDEGYVVSMSWGPSCSFQMTDSSSGCLKRLGLLAVACSSSVVLVYSLPQPDVLKSSSRGPIYKSKPSLVLTPNSSKSCGPCLSVAWQQSGECRYIIGGYSSGTVLLWDVLSQSPLLRVDQTTLRPMRCFKSSRSAVLSCSWNPRLSTAFVATAYDGSVCQFDMTNPELPVSSITSMLNLYRSTCWAGPMINGMFLAAENFKGVDNSPVNFYSITRNSMKNNFSDFVMQSHSSCVYDVTYCPFYEVLASCNSMGTVKASLPPLIKVITQALKGYTYWHKDNNPARDIYNLRVGSVSEEPTGPSSESCGEKSLVEINSCDVAESSKQPTNGDEEMPETVQVQEAGSLDVDRADVEVEKGVTISPESRTKLSNEAVGGDILYFCDGSLEKPNVQSSQENQDAAMFLTNNMNSIHRVRFNPNPASCLWLASGGQAGLLRLDDLSPLAMPQKASVKAFYDQRYQGKS